MPDRRAILIGVDGYSFRPLTSAVNDAVAMRTALLGGSGLAPIFAPDEIRLLLTPPRADMPESVPATRQAILDALKPHYDNPDPADFLLVFFAGHGVAVNPDGRVRETLLLPSDVAGPEDGRNMLWLTELLRLFSERGPREQLWIVDACRDMPYSRRPRGYSIEWQPQEPQSPRAQTAIFAVAQGGTALSAADGQGRFTSHVIAGLAGKGAAAIYDRGRYCVTAPSLHEYVHRRTREALADYDDWTRTIQMPQIAQLGPALAPLRDLPMLQPRSFAVTVEPSEAAPAVKVALEVQMGSPVQGWPPAALPNVYELRASLQPGMEQSGWAPPMPQLRTVDLREEDRAVIKVARAAAPPVDLEPTTGERGIAQAQTLTQKRSPFSVGILEVEPRATLTVRAVDAMAHVRMQRAQAPWTKVTAAPNVPFDVDPGVWDLMVMLGDEVVNATRVVLADRERRTIQTIAQITPATATLLSGAPAADAPSATPESVTVSDAIGPMQGAILRTLLPLLALKLHDTERRFLERLAHLHVPVLEAGDLASDAPDDEAPFVVAVAIEGRNTPELFSSVPGARVVWTGPASRVGLFAGSVRDPGRTVTIGIGARHVNVAAPARRGGVTVIAGAAWPDGRLDLSVGVFSLPVNTRWTADAPEVSADSLARALAVAVPLFRQGVHFEDLSDPALTAIAGGKAVDPILGALTFHARDYRLSAEAGRLHQKFAQHLRNVRETIRGSLRASFGELPDSRVIAALEPDREARRAALVALLQDSSLGQPVLTVSLAHLARAAIDVGWEDHWAVERFDRIAPDQVFNVVRIGREEGPDAATD